MSDPRTSVVVCTRNRSRLLADACAAILAVAEPAGGFELVIVDNRSDDDTPQVAAEVAAADSRVRVIGEAELGLSAARNAGIRASRGEIVVFIDDDAFPAHGWLVALVTALDDPASALAAGGPVAPRWASPPPAWIDGRYLPYLTVWDLGPEPQTLRYNEYPRGANVGFRRRVFARWGGFSTHLGRKGASLLSCEETELCLRIERHGGGIVYAPAAAVEHRVHGERITDAWMVARFGAQGRSEAVIDWMHGGFAGLRRGHRRFARAARDTAGTDRRHRRCQAAALAAYRARALRAPFTVPRYRPSEPLPPWRPEL